jgi:hypothetical protein
MSEQLPLPSRAVSTGAATRSTRPIDAAAVRERFDRLSALFADMMITVEDVSKRRCPYKNRLGECTAAFGCRNQRRPLQPGGLKICGGDDRIDYRSAWEPS